MRTDDLDADPTWYACYTRARHEKKVTQRLSQRGVESFLPLIPREREWHDRTKIVMWPMFPSYVFARVSAENLYQIVSTPGVTTIVQFGGEPVPIPDGEIENVRRFARRLAESPMEPEPAPLVEEGEAVEITSGPLEGVRGRVAELRGGERVLIHVGLDAIGQGLKVEVETGSVRSLREDE